MNILPGVIGGLVAVGLGAAALRSQKPAQADREGWKRLRPGWYLHLALVGCAAFVAVIALFFLTGGSSRADAEDQNFYALLLMLAFGAGGIWVLWAGYLRKVAWKGNEILLTAPFRRDARYRLSEVVGVSDNIDGSECKIHFADGRILRISIYFHGFRDFLADLAAHLPLDSEGRAA